MNFKPTLWKSIVSLVIAIAAFISGYWIKTHLMFPLDNLSILLKVLLVVLPRLDIYFFVLSLILVYVVWSLIQRKK